MEVQAIGFIPPVVGVEEEFNTFRLGSSLFKKLKESDEIFLMDEKSKVVFGKAKVLKVENGPLGEMCLFHAAKNHTQLAESSDKAPEQLFKLLQKIYGPHIATHAKKSTVIYLRRLE